MDNKKRQDDYLALSEYSGHSPSEKHADFLIFSKDGEHYFGMLDKNGDVGLRSEGYSKEASRDNGIESVIKNRVIEERYNITEARNHFFVSLKAGNNQEIAKSGVFKSKAEAEAYVAFLLGKSKSFGRVAAKSASGAAAAGAAAGAAVSGRIISVKRNQIGETRNVISETRNQIGETRNLIGENRRQIGETRNLINTNEKVTKYAAAGAAAASLGAMSFAGMSQISTGGPKKVEKVAAAKVGGWWPLLLFLLPLLLFIGCPPVVVPPAAIAWKAIPIVAPVTKCDCEALTHPIFKIPNEAPPKSTFVLGRAPEYGNSHGLTTVQFYNKLKKAYDGSADERRFLDGIFKQMGYDNGFKDATPELFTEVTIPQGINANLGTKVTHKTVYRKMETKGKDREAFRIKALNYCDFHFMKTCGNHMYYRENCMDPS